MIPININDWNYEIIKKLVDNNITESDLHDFKTNLPDTYSLSKIVCSFANSKGGYIIFGIKERDNSFFIEGIENDKEISKKFGDMSNDLIPTIPFFMFTPFILVEPT